MMKHQFGIGLCAGIVFFATGCGSGGSGGPGNFGGGLAMTIRWPARIAAPLPSGTQSVRVTLYRDGHRTDTPPQVIAGPKVLNKPDSPEPGPAKVAFENLPPGPVRAVVTAHGLRDAADPPCANGTGMGTIEVGKRAQIFVEMYSNAYRIEVSPSSIGLIPGQREMLGAKAFDFNNQPLVGIRFHWTSLEPRIAEVDSVTGEVKAISTGTTQIIAQEEYGGLHGEATVTVR